MKKERSVTSEEIQQKVVELEALRSQTRIWRIGSSIAIIVIVVFCVGLLVNSVHGLFRPGPVQDQFASALTSDLKRDVLPSVQSIASDALTQSKPEIEASFTNLNQQTPELTTSFMRQLTILQRDIPQRGDKALDATYGAMLKSQEAKIRQMFPEATEANVASLVDNMTTEGHNQIVADNDTLFSKHEAALAGIETDLTTIQNSETVTPDQDKANWEMAVSVVDFFHDDLKQLQSEGAQPAIKPAKGAK
jgi:hypothetical protein